MKKRFLEKILVPVLCAGLAVAMLTPTGITAFADDETTASESMVTSPEENDADAATDSVTADAEITDSTVGAAADTESVSAQDETNTTDEAAAPTATPEATATPTPTATIGTLSATTINLDYSGTDLIDISFDGNDIPNMKSLYFAVWSARDGQDDIIWREAEKVDQLWTKSISVSEFKPESGLYDGTYNVHCYAKLADGTMKFINSTTFEVTNFDKYNTSDFQLTRGTLYAQDIGGTDTVSDIYISQERVLNVKQMYLAIWSVRDGQDDIIWVKAERGDDGFYDRVIHLSEFSPKSGLYDGVYNVHCYAQLTNGTMEFVNSTTFTVTNHDQQKMYRLYNPNSGEHFFTSNEEERDHLKALGWHYEGVAWTAPAMGSPIYRLYNPNAGDHHYTGSEAEKDNLVKAGWKYEGVAWYSAPSSSGKPLYRLYNPNCTGAGAHHYTASTTERDNLFKAGWKYEGIGWYGV